MKRELQEKLFNNYPKIFRQKDLSMDKTAMCWGVETSNGWYWLINQLCNRIQSYIDDNKKPQVEATQVKEKFGALCFYTDGGDDLINGMVLLAEEMSRNICEECGSTNEVTCEGKNWIYTRCKNCKEKYEHKSNI